MVLIGSLLVLSSTAFSGATGIFAKLLFASEIPTLVMIWGRSLMAVAILVTALALLRPGALLVKRRDLPFFLAQGILQVLMSWLSFTAFTLAPVAVVVLVIYTAPALTAVLAALFLGESIVRTKVFGLGATAFGLILVVGVLESGQLSVNPVALAMAFTCSLCFAVWAVVGKVAVGRYSPWTVILYTQSIGFTIQTLAMVLTQTAIPAYTTTALATHVGSGAAMLTAFALYFSGLARMETSRASIVMMSEPMFATVLAFLFFGETLSAWQMVGAAFILGGAIIAQFPGRRRAARTVGPPSIPLSVDAS